MSRTRQVKALPRSTAGTPSRTATAMLRARAAGIALALVIALLPAQTFAQDYVGGVPIEQASEQAQAAAPDLGMPAGILVAPDGRELWGRDIDEQRAMASLTKMMTAVVVLENAELSDTVTITSSASRVGESSADISTGDTLTVRQLLEATLVKSGNDAAEALALHVAGTEAAFVEMMNTKAADLGMADTQFRNPHGLDEQGHYSSANDLSVLSRYAMGNEEFRRIVSLRFTTLAGQGGERTLENRNLLLGDYVGATGIKTGWTGRAGFCLSASARRDAVELYAIVLGAGSEDSRFGQAKQLLDWGFAHYSLEQLGSAEETVGAVPVSDYLDVSVPAIVDEDIVVPVFDLDGEITRDVALETEVAAPVTAGQRVGTLTIRQGQRLLAQTPVVSAYDVQRPGFLERMWIGAVRAWRSVWGEPDPA